MKTRNPREHVALGVIMLTLIVGGAWILVVPRMERLRDHRADLLRLQDAVNVLSLGPAGQAPAIDRAILEIQEKAESINARNELAANAEHLYEQVAKSARRYGLSVEHVRPGDAVDDHTGVSTRRLRISCSGSFESLDRFLQSLDQIEAYHRVMHVELLPFGPRVDGHLASTIEIAVYQFEVAASVIGPSPLDHEDHRVASEEVGP